MVFDSLIKQLKLSTTKLAEILTSRDSVVRESIKWTFQPHSIVRGCFVGNRLNGRLYKIKKTRRLYYYVCSDC